MERFNELFINHERSLAAIQLALVMFGMGTSLGLADFAGIARRKKALVVFALMQFLVLPALAFLIPRRLGFDDGVTLGLVLVACMPGGAWSNIFTWMARGNVALSIAMTATTTVLSVGTVPLMIEWLAPGGAITPPVGGGESAAAQRGIELSLAHLVRDVTLFLILPLLGGMSFRGLSRRLAERIGPLAIRFGAVALGLLVIGSLSAGRIDPSSRGLAAPLVIIGFAILTLQCGMIPFRVFGWDRNDRFAVATELTVRDINLALLLHTTLFPLEADRRGTLATGSLFVLLFYGATSLVVTLCAVGVFRLFSRRANRGIAAGVETSAGVSDGESMATAHELIPHDQRAERAG
jgi:BASS family bile acid:Na+ symporter